MDHLKVCFIGVGSIANRHIKNLRDVCKKRNVLLEIDAFRRSLDKVDGIDNVYCEIDKLPNNYDVIFITNPTELHLDTLNTFHNNAKHFFIEKPVVSYTQLEKAKNVDTRNDSIYYVACPLRYNAVIQYLKKNINTNEVISVRSISSSYLPEWRPGIDYRETYSAHKSLGGGVSIDLIHEWDYLSFLFGLPNKVISMLGKKSNLEIDSEDYAIYISEYDDMIVELHLDYFGRSVIREVMLIMKEDTIIADIVNNKIKYLKSGDVIEFNESRDDFQKRELEHFLDIIDGKIHNDSDYLHGLNILELTQGRIG